MYFPRTILRPKVLVWDLPIEPNRGKVSDLGQHKGVKIWVAALFSPHYERRYQKQYNNQIANPNFVQPLHTFDFFFRWACCNEYVFKLFLRSSYVASSFLILLIPPTIESIGVRYEGFCWKERQRTLRPHVQFLWGFRQLVPAQPVLQVEHRLINGETWLFLEDRGLFDVWCR